MRAFGVLAVTAVLSGCMGGADEPAAPPSDSVPVDSRLFAFEDRTLVEVANLPDVEISESGATWDARSALQQGEMSILLVQFREAGRYKVDVVDSAVFRTTQDGVPTAYEDACVGTVGGPTAAEPDESLDGNWLIAQAEGRDGKAPAKLPNISLATGVVHGPPVPTPGVDGGSVGGGGFSLEGKVSAAQWMLFGFGLSGIEPTGLGDGTSLRVNLSTSVSLDVYLLPPTAFACAMGFSPLVGSTSHSPAPLDVHVGGSLEVGTRYGGTFLWNNICWPAEGGSPFNQAEVQIAGNTTPLTQETLPFAIGSYDRNAIRLAVEQWRGKPVWASLGLATSTPATAVTEFPGCLDSLPP